ncbi:hypothetical protein [uncultured Hyphomonas sp.]|jgi:hypothetical protein|uniref:hypothetical protein n=1 Tax=uncultured Hyphomonas sp. TaxID=225298 RepID=UPI0030DDC0F3|tara:strand:+ start:1757 stop:2230 length:474 start_codon:yes stop_codon:yes gene_type:complete
MTVNLVLFSVVAILYLLVLGYQVSAAFSRFAASNNIREAIDSAGLIEPKSSGKITDLSIDICGEDIDTYFFAYFLKSEKVRIFYERFGLHHLEKNDWEDFLTSMNVWRARHDLHRRRIDQLASSIGIERELKRAEVRVLKRHEKLFIEEVSSMRKGH